MFTYFKEVFKLRYRELGNTDSFLATHVLKPRLEIS